MPAVAPLNVVMGLRVQTADLSHRSGEAVLSFLAGDS